MATKTKKEVSKLQFDKDTYLKWYKDMYLMRKFEEKCGQLYIQQKFGGFCHLYIGQEAVVAGTVSATKKGDKHITAYRDHAHAIGLGSDINKLMAELYGKTTGTSKGKGGSMHFFDLENGLWGGHGIVGAQIPMGAGIAFAEQYKGTDNVCVCSFGDGAVRQGGLHETFNMAMMWKIPVIFVIENNNYAMGTAVSRSTNVEELSKVGDSYEMPSEDVNGMSPEAVHESMSRAVERARRGDGPTLLNIKTYRYKGHSMSDPQKYRTKDEVKEYQEKDPVTHTRDVVLENGWMTEEEVKAFEKKTKEDVNAAVEFAENSPEPTIDELYKDVYKEDNYPFIEE